MVVWHMYFTISHITFVVPHFDAWLGSGRVDKMGANDGDGGKIDMERERVTCRNQPLYLWTREHPPTRVAILTR